MSPLALLLTLSLQSDPTATAVGLLPPTGAEPAVASAVGAQLRRSLETVEGFALQGHDRTLSEVDGARALGLICKPGDDACYGKLAVALRVDLLVVPALEDGELELVAYDAATGGRLNVVRDALPPEGPARLTRLRALLELLLVPERALGRVVVRTATGARVELDGERTAQGPLARFDAVRAGPHVLTVSLGERREQRSVDVVAGEDLTLDVELAAAPAPAPALDPLLLAGAGVGAAGALLALGGGAGALWATVTLEDPALPLRGEERTTTLRIGQAALAVAGLGVVAAVAGGALVGGSLIGSE